MLVFAGITPHSPFLLPSIGKENLELVKQTKEAFYKLQEQLTKAAPDVIVVLSPHSKHMQTDTFNIVVSHPEETGKYLANLKDFGDYTTQFNYKTDPEILHKIISLSPDFPISTSFSDSLDYATVVPLSYLLSPSQHNVTVVPLSVSALDRDMHISYGKALFEIFSKSSKRVAIIASADLAHTLSEDSPAGFHESGKAFDQLVINYLKQRRLEAIPKINPEIVEEAVSCGYNVLVLLAGLISHVKYEYHEFCYESPFGVGYLTGYFDFELYE